MVDELAITNEIWRKWDKEKVTPMPWAELRKKVEEYAKAGKDPHDLIEKYNPDKLKDLFTGRTLEGYVEAAKVRTLETFKGVTFYFETREDRQRAYELLARHDFHFPYGPDFSLTGIDNPDHMLEILASEGFETSRVLVERS